jgi:drug/metabolite transporter (DMT)-like permease
MLSPGLIGTACALATALAWAFAVLLFKKSGEQLGALALNYFKCVVGALLVLLSILLGAAPLLPQIPGRDVVALLASGAVGIAAADTLFFFSLNTLGAGRIAVVDCLSIPFVLLFSLWWLGERLHAMQALGAALVIASVALTGTYRQRGELSRRLLIRGFASGALAMALTAASIVAVKPILERHAVLWTMGLRMAGGLVAMTAVALAYAPARRSTFTALRPQRAWRFALPGAVVGSYLAVLLWIAGYKYAAAGVVSILNQTNTVLLVLLAAFFLGERLRPASVLAAALAFTGCVLVLV